MSESDPPEDHHAILEIRDAPDRDHLSNGEPLPSAAEGAGEDHGLDEAGLVLRSVTAGPL